MTFLPRILTEQSACGCWSWRLQVLERSQLVLLLRFLFHLRNQLVPTTANLQALFFSRSFSCALPRNSRKVLWGIPGPEHILAAISLNWLVKSWSLSIHLLTAPHNSIKASCSWIPWCWLPFCWWGVELLSCPLLLSCEEPPCSKSGPSAARWTLPQLFASVTTCISSVVSQWTISLSTWGTNNGSSDFRVMLAFFRVLQLLFQIQIRCQ